MRRRKSGTCSSEHGRDTDKVPNVVTSIQSCHFERSSIIRNMRMVLRSRETCFPARTGQTQGSSTSLGMTEMLWNAQ
jgi:hypothetical protein